MDAIAEKLILAIIAGHFNWQRLRPCIAKKANPNG